MNGSSLRAFLLAVLTGLVLVAQDPSSARPTASATELAAWKEVQEATRPPLPPLEWNNQQPSEEEYAAFRKQMGEAAARAADKALAFTTNYPDSSKLAEARELRVAMLQAAVQLGVSERAAELQELGGIAASPRERGTDPFNARMQAAMVKVRALEEKGMEAMLLEFEKQIREIMKDYPDRPEVYAVLLQVADGLGGEKGRAIAAEVKDSQAPQELKDMAAGLLKKAEMLGQPLELQFTATDGRAVNLADFRGKVVLVDFWATWCGPCIAELPKVKEAYERLNSKGFEIFGISFDEDKESLETFVKKNSMPWPQFFDDSGGPNRFGTQFGIQGIPTMWLVDKQGVLRDLNARQGLINRVEKLLAEN